MNIKRELQNMKQNLKELKIKLKKGGGAEIPTYRCGFFLSVIYRTSRQKISKDRKELNNTIHQWVLIDIYRILHSQTAKYIFFQVNLDDNILVHKNKI